MIRFVVTSDNHLGRYYAKMNARQLAERRARIRVAFAETIDFAIKQRAHFFLQCGDLFDREAPPPAELTFVAQQFQKLRDANIRIFAISGNHDMPTASDGATPVRIFDALRAARVFSKRTEIEFETIKVDDSTVALGGIAPDPRLDPGADPLEGVTYKAPRTDVTILLLHCGVEGHTPPDFADAILPKARIAAMQDVDYFFVGDIHRTAKDVIGETTLVIPGATERMNFGELKEKAGFYFVELDGKRAAKLQHKSIDAQAMRRETIRTTNLSAKKPTEDVIEQLREWSDQEQLFQLRLEGPLDREVYHRLRFYDVWRLGNDLNFYFDLDRAQVELESDDAVVGGGQVVSIHNEIERVAAELAATREGDERTLIEEARALVMEKLGRDNEN
ncbi:MAG: DNA repair exonuclease [Chloroflexi bacterium]|nr:DNA repair exonuclease [Chloroflexota bacterium]